MGILVRNGVEYDPTDLVDLVHTFFASKFTEADLFDMAMSEVRNKGSFEFVENNEVFVIKNAEV